MSNPGPQTDSAPQNAPAANFDTPEIQKMYRDITIYVKDTYFPHYNLYQVKMFIL